VFSAGFITCNIKHKYFKPLTHTGGSKALRLYFSERSHGGSTLSLTSSQYQPLKNEDLNRNCTTDYSGFQKKWLEPTVFSTFGGYGFQSKTRNKHLDHIDNRSERCCFDAAWLMSSWVSTQVSQLLDWFRAERVCVNNNIYIMRLLECVQKKFNFFF
jgi:hypothetical protein